MPLDASGFATRIARPCALSGAYACAKWPGGLQLAAMRQDEA
jgi:hypothetical protein